MYSYFFRAACSIMYHSMITKSQCLLCMEMNGDFRRKIKPLWNFADDVMKNSLIAGYQWVPILPSYFKISIAEKNRF